MAKITFNFSSINLWCAKNLVDTQFLLGKIFSYGQNNPNFELQYYTDPFDKESDFVFLNTCWFLSSGRQEMFETIDKIVAKGKKVYLVWCGLQYFLGKNLKTEAKEEVESKQFQRLINNPSVFFLSREDFEKVTIQDLVKWFNSKSFHDFKYPDNIRAYTNAEYWFEYLKIAEWCNNTCSFCIIPKIRGKQKSVTMEKIVDEIKSMVASWIKEIILIAQDSTRYGMDLYGKPALFELLEKIDKLPWNFMYRILYMYPDIVSLTQLQKLTKFKKFIPYFDIPLQHISSHVLQRMWRFYDEKYIYKFLEFIQKNFKTKFVRTNLIIWFPWETEEDFEQLCEFIQKYKFDNIALFEYHDEPLAASSKLDNKVDYANIHKRFLKIKKIRNWIKASSVMNNDEQRWFVMEIKQQKKSPVIVVRPWLHAPEIDAYVDVKLENITENLDWSESIDIWSEVMYIV